MNEHELPSPEYVKEKADAIDRVYRCLKLSCKNPAEGAIMVSTLLLMLSPTLLDAFKNLTYVASMNEVFNDLWGKDE